MPTRNVSLPTALDEYVASEIDSGRFGNASEVVRTALRQMQERDSHRAAKIAMLRAALKEGIASGAAEEGSFARVRTKLGLG